MPFDHTLNENVGEMAMTMNPRDMNPRDAAALADKLTNDDGVQRRVLAGDVPVEKFIADLAARADGVDPNRPLNMGIGSVDLGLRRASIRADWEREDYEQEERDRASRANEAHAEVDAVNKRTQSLTALGWDDRVAFDIAKRGDEETRRCQKLNPAAYERGHEIERGQEDKS